MACNRIPVEVWDIILEHLDARTIKSLRLTNKRGLHDLAIDSCWGSFVERLSLSADREKVISTLQSYNSAEDRLPCYVTFSIPVDNELVTSQSDHRLEANDEPWSTWHALGLRRGVQEQLEVNKSFFDTLVETFRALNKVREISFWEDQSRGESTRESRQLRQRFPDIARLYYLTMAAILESNIVLDCFQLHFVGPVMHSLPALVTLPFYSLGTPYSMDALKGRLPFGVSASTGLPEPGEQIHPKLKPEASNIRCLQAHVYRDPYGSEPVGLFTELIQFLDFACVEYVSLRNNTCSEHDLLRFLKENRTIRHLELSKVKINWGFWDSILNFLATGMPSLESLTLGHLQTSVPRSIPLVLVEEDPRDFPELTGDPNDASFSRTFSSAELARGLNFRGPVYYRGGRWEF